MSMTSLWERPLLGLVSSHEDDVTTGTPPFRRGYPHVGMTSLGERPLLGGVSSRGDDVIRGTPPFRRGFSSHGEASRI